METFIIICAVLAWWISGVAAFIFWWTKDWDLKVSDLVSALLLGLMLGPFAFIVGFLVHGGSDSKTLISKRK